MSYEYKQCDPYFENRFFKIKELKRSIGQPTN